MASVRAATRERYGARTAPRPIPQHLIFHGVDLGGGPHQQVGRGAGGTEKLENGEALEAANGGA